MNFIIIHKNLSLLRFLDIWSGRPLILLSKLCHWHGKSFSRSYDHIYFSTKMVCDVSGIMKDSVAFGELCSRPTFGDIKNRHLGPDFSYG